MDQETAEKYYKIPTINNIWTCPDCKIQLIVNVPRLRKTQIRQHLATYLHCRNSKQEEATNKRIEELEEMIEALTNQEDE